MTTRSLRDPENSPRSGAAERFWGSLAVMLWMLAVVWALPACDQMYEPSVARPAHLDRKTIEFAPGVTAEFIFIDAPRVAPDGFLMGSPDSEEGRMVDEAQFRAVLKNRYWLQTTQVTQAQWRAVTGAPPSEFMGETNPVDSVSWDDCHAFIGYLRTRGIAARLPTEAEWEFACRSGTATAYVFGTDDEELNRYGWFADNSGQARIDSIALLEQVGSFGWEKAIRENEAGTHPVGGKQANAWGFFDMHGNVSEWCAVWYGPYPSERTVDPTGPTTGRFRVLRGGSWYNLSQGLRSAFRSKSTPDNRNPGAGLRLALDAE